MQERSASTAMERHFTVSVPHLRAEMAATHLRQFDARHVP
jgi:hypothetical protein